MIRPRSLDPEIMDAEEQDPEELGASLEQVSQANRLFGGTRALRRHLAPLQRSGRDVVLLDVGAGNGDTAADLVAWGGRGGGAWKALALDPHPATARLAAGRVPQGVAVIRGNGLRLPLRDASVDVAVAVLVLHHLRDSEAVQLVAEMIRVSRVSVFVNDLERHPVNHSLARLMAATLWRRNRITRHDAPLSVLRSFTPPELLEIGRAAGLRSARVVRHLPYRLVLAGRGGNA